MEERYIGISWDFSVKEHYLNGLPAMNEILCQVESVKFIGELGETIHYKDGIWGSDETGSIASGFIDNMHFNKYDEKLSTIYSDIIITKTSSDFYKEVYECQKNDEKAARLLMRSLAERYGYNLIPMRKERDPF